MQVVQLDILPQDYYYFRNIMGPPEIFSLAMLAQSLSNHWLESIFYTGS